MKKILLGLCALSAVSFSAVIEGNRGEAIYIPVQGTITVENDPVIQGKKIVIYKDGPVGIAQSIDLTFKLQKSVALRKEQTLQNFIVREVPSSGLTETQIRQGNNYDVESNRIQVGLGNGASATISQFTAITGNPGWTLTTLTSGSAGVLGSLKLKSGYNTSGKKVEVYLEGTPGATAGNQAINARYAIKVN